MVSRFIVLLVIMTSIKDLTEMGKEIGYKGQELAQFIKDQQAEERERRRLDRETELELKKLEVIKVEELKKLEAEKAENRMKADEHKNQLDRTLAREKFEYELNLAKNTETKAPVAPTESSNKLKGHKLPFFDDDKDNIDSYLLRFERYANLQGWKQNDWSVHLSALLKGKALDVYRDFQ